MTHETPTATSPGPPPHPVDHEPAGLAVVTLSLWLTTLAIGFLGAFWPYPLPHPVAATPPPPVAEPLEVQLTQQAQAPRTTTPASASPTTDPVPPAPTLPTVAPVPMLPLTTPASFTVPTALLQPEASAAPTSVQPTPIQTPSSAAPVAPQKLTFGVGEGRQPLPDYPPRARREGQEGTVGIRLSVGPDGRVLSAEALRPSPWALLNEAALRTVRERWRFSPGPPKLYDVLIRFELNRP